MRHSEIAFKALSGAAGNRTPVQTSKPYAFYMFILLLIFVSRLGTDTLTSP